MSGTKNMQTLEAERSRRENPESGPRFVKVTHWPNRAEKRRLARTKEAAE